MPDRRDDFAIHHVASLARLHLTREEEAVYARQLGEILALATQLVQFDAGPLIEASPAAAVPSMLRADLARPSIEKALVLGSAPDCTDDGLFRVPRVIG